MTLEDAQLAIQATIVYRWDRPRSIRLIISVTQDTTASQDQQDLNQQIKPLDNVVQPVVTVDREHRHHPVVQLVNMALTSVLHPLPTVSTVGLDTTV